MTGVVHSDRIRQRGGVRIEYIVAAVVCLALLVAMTAVLLSVSDRKAKRELVRQPNTRAPSTRLFGPDETSSNAHARPTPAPGTPAETPVVVTMTPPATPANTPDTPVVVTMTPPATPAGTAETPVVVTMTPPATPAGTAETPVVVVESPQQAAAAADTGPEIAADSLDTLKVGTRPQGANWSFGTSGGTVFVQPSPQEDSRCLRLLDNSTRATVWAKRKFPSQSQQLGFQCRLRIGQAADGYVVGLLGGEQPAVMLVTRGGELGCWSGEAEWHALQPYEANVWYAIRIAVDVKGQTFNVYIDGVQRGEKLKFCNAVPSLDAWQAETPTKLVGTLYLNSMKVTER